MTVSQTARRVALVTLVVGVAGLAAATLVADTPVELKPADPTATLRPQPAPWQDCPIPSCMAPCIYPPAAEVRCKEPGGPAFVTSYSCCCCGGSEGVRFQPL